MIHAIVSSSRSRSGTLLGIPTRSLRDIGVTVGLLICAAGAWAQYSSTVIVSGLNNPRGLTFGPDGGLYVAEAGIAAGSGPTTVVRGDTITLTHSGSVTRYLDGSQTRAISGLASNFNSTTMDVVGPADVLFSAGGLLRIAIGTGFDPALRFTDLGPGGAQLGQLLTPGIGSVDVSAFETRNNPAGGPLDSNPWRMAAIAGATLVTDAGGNSLLRVGDDGAISTVATFASQVLGGPRPTESVPTGIAVGSDGAYYVGELTGFPFQAGSARVHRVMADGTQTVFASGFTMITDLAMGADGSLYVLEYDSNGLLAPGDEGALWRVAPDGSRSLLFNAGLDHPTGLAIGDDGAFYISNFGDSSGGGEVLRVSAVPEPETYVLLSIGIATFVGWRRRGNDESRRVR